MPHQPVVTFHPAIGTVEYRMNSQQQSMTAVNFGILYSYTQSIMAVLYVASHKASQLEDLRVYNNKG